MAAPTLVTGFTGATDAGGAWAFTFSSGTGSVGDFCIVSITQDGNTNGALTSIVGTNIEDLAGTDNVWTTLPGPNADGSWPLGNPAAARQHIFFGRRINASAPTISGGNSTSEDLYYAAVEYTNVNAGTTLASVIENGTAGNANNTVDTGTALTDTAVVTLGPDRLAINILGANDDGLGSTDWTGESGGTWVFDWGFESASGTDGTTRGWSAAMASAGTIDGGTITASVSSSWGIVGFALIGTTPDTVQMARPHLPFVYMRRNR